MPTEQTTGEALRVPAQVDLADRIDAAPEVRLVPYAYNAAFGRPPEGVWRVPGAITLLRAGDAALAIAARWGAIVAGEQRDDGIVELTSMSRPTETARAPARDLAEGTRPEWSRPGLAVVWELGKAGWPVGGANLLVNTDLPDGAGLATPTALAGGVALALRDLCHPELPLTDLVAITRRALAGFVSGHGGDTARCAAALLGRAATVTSYAGMVRPVAHVPFDLAAAGLRLLVIDGRVRVPTSPADHRLAERTALEPVLDEVRHGGPTRLGPPLTAAHDSLRRAGATSVEQDIAVSAAREAGAHGARALADTTGRPAVALAPAASLREIRGAITSAYATHGLRTPRMFTVSAAEGARRVA